MSETRVARCKHCGRRIRAGDVSAALSHLTVEHPSLEAPEPLTQFVTDRSTASIRAKAADVAFAAGRDFVGKLAPKSAGELPTDCGGRGLKGYYDGWVADWRRWVGLYKDGSAAVREFESDRGSFKFWLREGNDRNASWSVSGDRFMLHLHLEDHPHEKEQGTVVSGGDEIAMSSGKSLVFKSLRD